MTRVGSREETPFRLRRELPEMVTVVVPMLDAEVVIGDQLRALAAQEYGRAWEVVVADNGSTDDSVAHVRSWQPRLPGLRIVDASDTRGASHARNAGAAAALGDFILFVDADDVVAPGWLSAMAHAAARHDFVCGRQEPFVVRRGCRRVVGGRRGIQPGDGFLPWAFGGSLGIKKEIFTRVGGFREDAHFGEDVDFCWRVQLAGTPLQEVEQAVVGYREPLSLLALARQQFIWGMRRPSLDRDFARRGTTLRRAAREFAWVLTRAPYLALSERRRRLWIAMTAGTTGRLWGAWKCRGLHP
jgi:glycosyltransferase involved in cell wall biosynthesis